MPGKQTHERSSKEEGITYDKETGRCRNDQGQFVECPPGMEEKGGTSRGGRSEKGGESHGRGLASASQETRERVAKMGGEASHGGRGSSKSEK